ncbi:MAG TPA: DUF6596 domain-containing protein [Puia sp.]|nr:DUF6596 domain-containing protein [Puia sp.]
MDHRELIPHLFRTEARKIAAVLSKLFGIGNIGLAEDITGDTFLAAFETWPYKGIPENPTAWLYTVAKNKARNYLKRHHLFINTIQKTIQSSVPTSEEPEIDLSEKNITDSQLQMLFAICHPCNTTEGQVGLALRILCGFGIEEIATAFLTNKETINKRLLRAKERLRAARVAIELPPDKEIPDRLDSVLTTLYLLFNEGYYSESRDSIIREELCLEAMRLTYLLLENSSTNLPAVNGLMSLMCFHTSRLPARKDKNGELVLYRDQDEALWNLDLISQGAFFLRAASQGDQISKYHLEAAIAFWHTQKDDTAEKWESILQLYNRLLQLEYSPIAALNRTFALAKARTKEEAIVEAEELNLTGNHFYFALLGELYTEIDDEKALRHFSTAFTLAKTQADKSTIQRKMEGLQKPP